MQALHKAFTAALEALITLGPEHPRAMTSAKAALSRCGAGDLIADVAAVSDRLTAIAAVLEDTYGVYCATVASSSH